MNLMDKIKHFESLPKQTVSEFNKLFTNCKLSDLAGELEVEIGELADSDTTRMLSVGSLLVKHSFVPVSVLEMSSEGFAGEYREKQRTGRKTNSWRA